MWSFFFWLTLSLAVANWIAVGRRWRYVEYITKPATLLALLMWLAPFALTESHLAGFLAGLALSLVGDVLLMLPRQQFVGGLVAFLLAHLAYIVGFNQRLPPWHGLTLLALVVVIGLGWTLYHRLVVRVPTPLRWPVMLYLGVISLMWLSATLTWTRPDWSRWAAASVTVGATLFLMSDLMLAWDRFVAPVRHSRVLVMITYHLGQVGLIVGVVWQWGGVAG